MWLAISQPETITALVSLANFGIIPSWRGRGVRQAGWAQARLQVAAWELESWPSSPQAAQGQGEAGWRIQAAPELRSSEPAARPASGGDDDLAASPRAGTTSLCAELKSFPTKLRRINTSKGQLAG